MLYQSHNPYSVLSETISFDNVQKMGELITLKTLRGSSSYSKYTSVLYRNYVNDLNRKNQANKKPFEKITRTAFAMWIKIRL